MHCTLCLFALLLLCASVVSDPKDECLQLQDKFAKSEVLLIGGISSQRTLVLISTDLEVYELRMESFTSTSLSPARVVKPVPLNKKWPELGDNATFRQIYSEKKFVNAITVQEGNETDWLMFASKSVIAANHSMASLSTFTLQIESKAVQQSEYRIEPLGESDAVEDYRWLSGTDGGGNLYGISNNVNQNNIISLQQFKLQSNSFTIMPDQKQQSICVIAITTNESNSSVTYQMKALVDSTATCDHGQWWQIDTGFQHGGLFYLFSPSGVIIFDAKIYDTEDMNEAVALSLIAYDQFIVCSNSSRRADEGQNKKMIPFVIIVVILLLALCIFVCLFVRQRPEPVGKVKKPIPTSKPPDPKNPSTSVCIGGKNIVSLCGQKSNKAASSIASSAGGNSTSKKVPKTTSARQYKKTTITGKNVAQVLSLGKPTSKVTSTVDSKAKSSKANSKANSKAKSSKANSKTNSKSNSKAKSKVTSAVGDQSQSSKVKKEKCSTKKSKVTSAMGDQSQSSKAKKEKCSTKKSKKNK